MRVEIFVILDSMDLFLFFSDLVGKLGYAGVALTMFIESVFPPIPSELVLPFAGFAAAQGHMTLWGAYVAATLGAMAGAVFWYTAGRSIGIEVLNRMIAGWGKPFGLRLRDVEKAQEWFYVHGTKAVFFGRMIPGIRSLISVPAGLSKMPFWLFMTWSAIGTALWSIVLITAGYFLGDNYDKVAHIVDPLSKIVLVIVVVGGLGFLAWRLLKTSSEVQIEED